MAQAQEVSPSTVNRLWQMHNIKPHLSRTFKLSRDAQFLQKLTDVVGLYLNPPQKALVLCVDEKSQIQALDRTQPGLPLKKGRCGTMTHDYKRNGTTTLFAALNVLDGKVIGQCQARHRHQEWLKFLRRLDREFPRPLTLHLIMDNYGTHKEPSVRAWLKKHRRFVCHFIPTSSSWLNLVERWFKELSDKAIRASAGASRARTRSPMPWPPPTARGRFPSHISTPSSQPARSILAMHRCAILPRSRPTPRRRAAPCIGR
jgi:transposase